MLDDVDKQCAVHGKKRVDCRSAVCNLAESVQFICTHKIAAMPLTICNAVDQGAHERSRSLDGGYDAYGSEC